jgi:hypothetical protein
MTELLTQVFNKSAKLFVQNWRKKEHQMLIILESTFERVSRTKRRKEESLKTTKRLK